MLRNPCACKGSLSYVHEECLIKWLLQKNIRKCELCHSDFEIREQIGNLWDIMKNTVKYMFKDSKRFLKVAIYSVYMYLFFKRFVHIINFFKDIALHSLKTLCRMIVTSLKLIFVAPSADYFQAFSQFDHFGILSMMLRLVRRIFLFVLNRKTEAISKQEITSMLHTFMQRLIKVLSFVYNSFILVQLSCIGYSESFRIKRVLSGIINQNKQIRIMDRYDQDK